MTDPPTGNRRHRARWWLAALIVAASVASSCAGSLVVDPRGRPQHDDRAYSDDAEHDPLDHEPERFHVEHLGALHR